MKRSKRKLSPEAILRRKYTRLKEYPGEGWTCYFEVGCQGFIIVENVSKKDARWFADMLSRALHNLVNEETASHDRRD